MSSNSKCVFVPSDFSVSHFRSRDRDFFEKELETIDVFAALLPAYLFLIRGGIERRVIGSGKRPTLNAQRRMAEEKHT